MFRTLAFLIVASISHSAQANEYYDAAKGMSGDDLRKALHAIIDGHRALPYTRSTNKNWLDGENLDVWEALVYTDSACIASEPNCGRVRLLYLDDTRSVQQANRGQAKHDSWDREHVWPKSRGFKKKSQDGYTDLHHLRPADRNINGAHSNYGFDYGGEPVLDKLADGTEVFSGAFLDKENQSFEPPDGAKGQVARMIFYMAVRYEQGDDAKPELMPDLVLKDQNARVREAWIGDLCTLLDWNNQFLPQDFERRRNDRVQQIQGNRNPFIDHPEWARLIWGEQCL